MNRVVLCGRLAGRPKLAYTPCGVAIATFRLLVPRGSGRDAKEGVDGIDCLAIRQLAVALNSWGERDTRVNLEGRLRFEEYRDGDGSEHCGLRVHADHAYCADPNPESPVLNLKSVLNGPGANGHVPPVPAEQAA